MKVFHLLQLLFLLPLCVTSQDDGVFYNSPKAQEGYTLFTNFESTYLVDNCGSIINEWGNAIFPSYHVKLEPNGNIIYLRSSQIIEADWEDNIVQRIGYDIPNIVLEYEVIKMKNGNFLCIGREFIDVEEFISLGFDDSVPLRKVDVIVEIDPTTETIVWMWNIKDHVLQERSPSLPNYGLADENPHLFDMDALETFDWVGDETFMINGFDYNEELDLIALSIRKMGEVVIIDHSTSTEEARTGEGGKYGKGGDILFRWGNPENYGRGTQADRHLYFQHNPNWIKHGVHKDKIIIYNNRLTLNDYYSSVEIINPSTDASGHFILPEGEGFKIEDAPISINEVTTGTSFYSGYTSGAKILDNGNILITTGQTGQVLEVNEQGDVFWEYFVPKHGGIFRTEKYSADYPAFEGKDLTPLGFVEDIPNSYDCELATTSVEEDLENEIFNLQISQTADKLIIAEQEYNFDLLLYNVYGQIMYSIKDDHIYQIDKSNLASGQYFILATNNKKQVVESVFLF